MISKITHHHKTQKKMQQSDCDKLQTLQIIQGTNTSLVSNTSGNVFKMKYGYQIPPALQPHPQYTEMFVGSTLRMSHAAQTNQKIRVPMRHMTHYS
jgi:hypothetical protein